MLAKALVLPVSSFSAESVAGSFQKTVFQQPQLSVEAAQALVDEAIRKAEEMGLKLSISIFDQHNNLKLFKRMDGAFSVSIEVSQVKASTSARLPLSTKQFGKLGDGSPNLIYALFPKVNLAAGGLPLFAKSGEHIGSIGISGSSAANDEIVAIHAVETLGFAKPK